jgi:ATP-dependent Clp protease adaptor protein ClpS
MTDHEKRESAHDEAGMNATPVKPRKESAPKQPPPRELPRWKVLLHNDDVNEVEKVVQVIRQLTHLSKDVAVQRTLEADKTGVSLLLVTHQERAELYVDQFASFKLTVTAEPEG